MWKPSRTIEVKVYGQPPAEAVRQHAPFPDYTSEPPLIMYEVTDEQTSLICPDCGDEWRNYAGAICPNCIEDRELREALTAKYGYGEEAH